MGKITLHDNEHYVHKEPFRKERERNYGRKDHENNNPMRTDF